MFFIGGVLLKCLSDWWTIAIHREKETTWKQAVCCFNCDGCMIRHHQCQHLEQQARPCGVWNAGGFHVPRWICWNTLDGLVCSVTGSSRLLILILQCISIFGLTYSSSHILKTRMIPFHTMLAVFSQFSSWLWSFWGATVVVRFSVSLPASSPNFCSFGMCMASWRFFVTNLFRYIQWDLHIPASQQFWLVSIQTVLRESHTIPLSNNSQTIRLCHKALVLYRPFIHTWGGNFTAQQLRPSWRWVVQNGDLRSLCLGSDVSTTWTNLHVYIIYVERNEEVHNNSENNNNNQIMILDDLGHVILLVSHTKQSRCSTLSHSEPADSCDRQKFKRIYDTGSMDTEYSGVHACKFHLSTMSLHLNLANPWQHSPTKLWLVLDFPGIW